MGERDLLTVTPAPPAEPASPDGPGTPAFGQRLGEEGLDLRRGALQTLQINVGKRCNQACRHCHVDAGPTRTEVMSRETMDRILGVLAASGVRTVDITGGAPEMNPGFRYLVERVRQLDRQVMVRCNLTVILEPGQTDLPAFYRRQEVELVCSLPCYLEENVDTQRGRGVFGKSIRALRALNRIGYGTPGTGLFLHLVYNPVGDTLPPPQAELEADYHQELYERYGVAFNHLYTITNMPISRFGDYLRKNGRLSDYMDLLVASFNPDTVEHLMCRQLLSVDWQGNVYDCDFNQMLDLHVENGPRKLWELSPSDLEGRPIRTANHCYGCTAGAGSSCGGKLVG